MKKIFTLLLLLFYAFLFAQKSPEKAPSDPAYFISSEELHEMSENGIILPPIKPLHDPWTNYQTKEAKGFPIVYDMRTTPWLTSVKSQSAGGCWAYSVMGALESRLLMLGLGEYDLSDNHLQNCHKYVPERSGNGNQWMATAFFARRSGPIRQNEYSYPGGGQYYNCCPDTLQALYYVHQARYPAAQNNSAIKQTVLDYGAVWSLLYYNQTYLNSGNHTYYYGGNNAVNHAGCVVGWNDTLSTAGGTGVWIVKNTYGSNWEDNGYYYISYHDSQFLKYNGYWPEVMGNEANTLILQYDDIGGYWGAGGWNQTAYGLVKFEVPETDVVITKVGTFVVYAGTTLEFKIYNQFNNSLSGLLGMKADVTAELPGYYTFDLDTEILIPAGQAFYIQVKYNSNNPELKWPAAIEDTIQGYSKPVIETGKYWLAPDPNIWPTAWYPIGHGTSNHYDLCIKAYAEKVMRPAIAVSNVEADNDEGFCNASVDFSASVSGTPTPTVTYQAGNDLITSPHVFDVGTTTVTVYAGNICGTESSSFTVTVIDAELPVVRTQDIVIQLDVTGYALIDPELDIDNGSTDNCGIDTYHLNKSSFTPANKGNNEVMLTITDIHGNSDSKTANVFVESIPAPWKNCNTHTSANGTADYDFNPTNPTFRITATGQSTTTNDVHHFVYQDLTGNGTIIARLADVQNGGYAGVMMRQDCSHNAAAIYFKTLLYNPNVLIGTRTSQGQAMRNASQVAQLIRWMKIQRNGTNFRVFTSYNGTTWQQRYSGTINMTGPVQAGIFTESVRSNRTSIAWFDHVEVQSSLKTDTDFAIVNLDQHQTEKIPIEIYPNPATDQLTILYPYEGKAVKLSISVMDGRNIYTRLIHEAETQINVESLQPGVYFLRFENEDRLEVRKLVIQ